MLTDSEQMLKKDNFNTNLKDKGPGQAYNLVKDKGPQLVFDLYYISMEKNLFGYRTQIFWFVYPKRHQLLRYEVTNK